MIDSSNLVPGVMRCAKCSFQLVRVTLAVNLGKAIAGNSNTEPCPNGCGPLWPVTWEQYARQMEEAAEQMAERALAAERRLEVLQGTTPELSHAELGVIRALIALARATFLALEDSEEFEGDHGRCHSIDGQAFDDISEALDALDELPDDRPGYRLAPYGKAQWALRRILSQKAPRGELDPKGDQQ